MVIEQKKCSKCGIVKPLTDFGNNISKSNGKDNWCRKCKNEYQRGYYIKNKEKILKQSKEYMKNNLDKYKKYNKKYRENNKEKIKKNQSIWYNANKERVKKYTAKNRDKYYMRNWVSKTLSQHKTRGNKINISKDTVEKIAIETSYCPICGCKLNWGYNTGFTNESPTLDSVNNENELRKDNIWIICNKCNATKRDRTMNEFVEYCKNIYKKYGND